MSKRKVLAVAVALLLVLGLFIVLSNPSGTSGSVTFTTETPSVAPVGMLMSTRSTVRERVRITRIRHHIRFRKIGSRSTGPCYRIDARVVGENGLIDDIVTGTGHFHWCVSSRRPVRIVDKYSYANKDHTESWGWSLDSIETTAGQGWSDKWCLEFGEQGPCQAVEYRYWRFTFRWSRGIDILGQELKLHKVLYAACTVRGNPGGYHCGTGEA